MDQNNSDMKWERVEIGDFMVSKRKSINPKKHLEETFELYSIPSYDEGIPEIAKGKEIGSSKKLLQNNDILLSRIVPHIRRCWVINSDSDLKKIGSGEWMIFNSSKVIPNYLKYFFLSDLFSAHFLKDLRGVGGSLLRANPTITGQIKIPLPPLSEQRRLAARLDKADAVRQKSRALVEAYAELGRSVFLEVFGDIHRNNKWKEEPLEKVIKEIKSGTSYSGDDRPLQKNEFGVLKISAVTSGRFKPEYKAVPKDSIDKELVFVEPGDLLFSRANTRELVAATCIVDDEYPNLFLPDKLWRIRLDQTLANPIFFKYVLSYPPFRSRITKKATGTSGSMLNVSMKKLKETYFPLPPLPLQTRFAAMVANIEAQRRLAERQLAAAEAVFGGVLQGTFER